MIELHRSPKKIALWFLIISVALSAILGIMAILSGNFGWFELRIILTTITISVASICALADAALWESKGNKPLPASGLVLSVLGAALLVWGIWVEPGSEQFWKFAISICVLAVATSHVCLLSLASLSRRFAWARLAAFAVIYSLALLIILSMEIEITESWIFQLIGVNSILVAAISIMIPVFHRLSASDLEFKTDDHDTETGQSSWTKVRCPKCSFDQFSPLGEIVCRKCSCKFLVKLLEP